MKSRAVRLPATEQRNPRTTGLDQKSTAEILRILNREDARVARAVARELPAIARAVDAIVAAFKHGGRLIYVGAGSSGRMGALDASECPPTFSVPKSQVQAIIAGGRRALTDAIEGAEDSEKQGASAIRERKVRRNDVVVGIAAAGSTPFVLAALREAKKRGAFTVGLTANRNAPISKIAQVTIAPNTGPEAIAGSTRMKAGTAQKLVLNMLSTTAMIRMGHVYDNWMINVAATNQKLRRRALRILEQAADTNLYTAEHALRLAGHDLRTALVMLKSGVSAKEARARLISAHENIRIALRSGTHQRQKKN